MKYWKTIPLLLVFLASGSTALADNAWSGKTAYEKPSNEKHKSDKKKKRKNHDHRADDRKSTPRFVLGKKFDYLKSLIETNQTAIVHLDELLVQLNTGVGGLRADYVSLQSRHESDVARLESLLLAQQQSLTGVQQMFEQEITSVRTQLQQPVAELMQTVSSLSLEVSALSEQLGGVTEPRLQQVEDDIQSINTQLDDINTSLTALDARVLTLESTAVVVEDEQNDGTLCLSLTNTADIDITNNDWFDQCIDMPGTHVRIVLKDASDTVIYSAEGLKNTNWTQNSITSFSSMTDQYHSDYHTMIALDNGDNLMITAKDSANSGCGGSLGNGYGIVIYGPMPDYVNGIKMLVMSYNQFNTYVGSRAIQGWAPQNEITYADGGAYSSCSDGGQHTVANSGFMGTFEMYIY